MAEGRGLFKTEDTWAIWLGLLVIALALGLFFGGSSLKAFAVKPSAWSSPDELGADLSKKALGLCVTCAAFLTMFGAASRAMGRKLRAFIPGFLLLFLASVLIATLAAWSVMQRLDLGAPLLALIIGLLLGNLMKVPEWLQTSLRAEFYVKTGIVLLGATLPFTLIAKAGPIAFLQATLVSVSTWLTIFLAATRLFKLDPRFGAVLGTGGAVCGVSGSIAIGGAVKAEREHISIGIAVVSIWALLMIFALTFLTKIMIPEAGADPAWWHLAPGEAGAWVGTSEYADAAGLAVVSELSDKHGDAPLQAFTLMKVIGRDMWIGIWAFILSIVSVVYWERRAGGQGPSGRLGFAVVWERFPKFVLGFLGASLIMSLVSAMPSDRPGDWFQADLAAPIKTLRDWAFVLCFLSIGLATRIRDLWKFGLKPFWAFTIGVLVNVPLGWFLTTQVFSRFWRAL